tara:strand:+ start:159 stop:611 length:453 start_codon:yes stop_codon:yes gene_type:complete
MTHQPSFPKGKKVETTDQSQTQEQQAEPQRKAGRPKGAKNKAMTIQRYADNPPAVIAKTDYARQKELRDLLLRSAGKDVTQKVIQIALNDDHPGQMAAIKMCMDRTLPVSMFEKDKGQRSAVTINITGIGVDIDSPKVVDMEIEDVEVKP